MDAFDAKVLMNRLVKLYNPRKSSGSICLTIPLRQVLAGFAHRRCLERPVPDILTWIFASLTCLFKGVLGMTIYNHPLCTRPCGYA